MIDHFLLYALLGGIGLSLIAGPLGCFVIWRKMAFFGDAISHSALLGVGFGIYMKIDPFLTILSVSFAIALFLLWADKFKMLATDTYLGIASHTCLSSGLILLSLLPSQKLNLMTFLLGDILSLTMQDLIFIYAGAAITYLILYFSWTKLIAMSLSEDIALSENIPVKKYKFFLLLALVLIIAFAVKIVGVLLITALFIIPAATAHSFSSTPERMAIGASIVAIFANISGIGASYYFNTPTGPSIVFAAAVVFFALSIGKSFYAHWSHLAKKSKKA